MTRRSMGTPTIKTVAELAKTSPSTASRALANYPHVREEVRNRVIHAAQVLHYTGSRSTEPNAELRTMASVPDYPARGRMEAVSKARIGRYVANQWIQDGDVIVLDSGTTVYEVALHLATSPIVYTYSIPLLDALSRRAVTVFCAPGRYYPPDSCNVGDYTVAFFENLTVHRAFLACHKFDVQTGPCNLHEEMDRIRRAIVEAAEEVFILADHSKFTDAQLKPYMPLEAVRAVITDTLPDRFRQAWRTGVELIETDSLDIAPAMGERPR